jgi:AAA+ superfamily predicted ATPase
MTQDSDNLQLAIDWLGCLTDSALAHWLEDQPFNQQPPLSFYPSDTGLMPLLESLQPSFEEFALLILALVPHCQPDFFSQRIGRYFPNGHDFPEFGGVKASQHRGLIPTGETAQFLLAGKDLHKRLAIQQLLCGSQHSFSQQQLLWLDSVPEGEPVMSGRLLISPELVELLTVGSISKPRFSMDFPAEALETELQWQDLVLHQQTQQQIQEIHNWINHHPTLLQDWEMAKKIKPGYRALFYGPPGTGKTLTASLLGKHTAKDVFRIDLSRVVSKYIGETEKNLARLFDKAENKDWILFFDEADALFGKRTEIRDAHDKYANQEIAYLLQRIETYNGLVILASNQKTNIDDAFARRFHSIIHFPMPRPEERFDLWHKTLPPQIKLAADIDLLQIATRYELSGAAIVNIVHYCAIEFLAHKHRKLELSQLERAIQRELTKEGKII